MLPDRKQALPLALVAAAITALTVSPNALAEQNGDQSLYKRLGGLPAISVVVSDFLDAMIPDPELNENPAINKARKRVPAPYLTYRVTAFMCQATGGPCEYKGRGMAKAHEHLNITPSEWDRMVTIFKKVLAEHDVPDAETRELLKLIGSTRGAIVASS